jgi:hypothetical protein
MTRMLFMRSEGRQSMAGNKYGARKVTAPNGEIFDSSKEYRRFCELKLLEKVGKISGLKRQVTFELIPYQREKSTEVYKGGPQKGLPKPGAIIEKPCKYVADFVYCDADGNTVVEDTKGCKKGAAYDLFVIKRKLFLYRYGIKIKET